MRIQTWISIFICIFYRAHLQITQGCGSTTKLRSVLEQFLKAWRLVDGVDDEQIYVSLKTEEQVFSLLSVEKYLEIVDVYVARLLGTVVCDFDTAISWTENADLPEEKRRVRFFSFYVVVVVV